MVSSLSLPVLKQQHVLGEIMTKILRSSCAFQALRPLRDSTDRIDWTGHIIHGLNKYMKPGVEKSSMVMVEKTFGKEFGLHRYIRHLNGKLPHTYRNLPIQPSGEAKKDQNG